MNKQDGTHSVEMCALLWKIMTWCHRYQIAVKARHIPGCLNMMADLLSRSNQVQSTEWSLHRSVQTDLSQVVLSSCRSICHSPEPQSSIVHVSSARPKCLGHRCSKHKLVKSRCLCLPFHSSPSQGDPKSQAIGLPDHHNSPGLARDALVLGSSVALIIDLTSTSSVNNSSQTFPQLCVPQQSTAWCLRVDSSKNKASPPRTIAAPQRLSTRTIYQSRWALFERWCTENSVGFLHSLYKASLRLLYVPVPRSKQAPFDHRWL